MRWDELSPQQAADWTAIVSQLSDAGWEVDEQTREFRNGRPQHWQAILRHRNAALELIAMYRAPGARINLIFRNPDGEDIHIRIEYGAALDDLLKAMVEFQDQVASATTVQQAVRGIVAICPNTYVAVDDDTLVKLRPDGTRE